MMKTNRSRTTSAAKGARSGKPVENAPRPARGKRTATARGEAGAPDDEVGAVAPDASGTAPQAATAPKDARADTAPAPASPLNPHDPTSVLDWTRHLLGAPAEASLPDFARHVRHQADALAAEAAARADIDARLNATVANMDRILESMPEAALPTAVSLYGGMLVQQLARVARAIEASHEHAYVLVDENGRPSQVVQGPRRVTDSLAQLLAGRRYPPTPAQQLAASTERLLTALEAIGGPPSERAEQPEPDIPAGHLRDVMLGFPSLLTRQIHQLLASGAEPYSPPSITAGAGLSPDKVWEGVILRWPHAHPDFLQKLTDDLGAVPYEPTATTQPTDTQEVHPDA